MNILGMCKSHIGWIFIRGFRFVSVVMVNEDACLRSVTGI